ncbi:MAG: O-antigen ligase family protein [Candidatus Zixiibacteriota bacterium]
MQVNSYVKGGLSGATPDIATPSWLFVWTALLVFLFPVVVATTNGGGSYVYTLLVLPTLYFGRDWQNLSLWERRILLGFVVAFLAMSLSLVNSEDVRQGLKYLERYLRIVLMIPVYLMLRRYGFALGRVLGGGAIVAVLVMAAQGWYQVNWLGHEFASGYYHKIVFGDLAVLWGALAVVFALTMVRGGLGIGIAAIASAAALYASILSHTRGSWLFIPVFIFTLLWVYRKQFLASRQVVLGGVVAVFALMSVGIWQGERFVQGVERGAEDLRIFMQDPSAGTSWGIRLNLWRNTLLIVEGNPLLGTGLGDFHQDMRAMAADGRSWSTAVEDFGHAHSIYFDALANAGLVGLAATVVTYLLLPFMAFVRGLRRAVTSEQRFYAMGGLVTVLAFATFGLSEALWARNPFVNTYIICIVVFLAGVRSSRARLVKGE